MGRTKDCCVNLHLLQGITLGLLCKVLQAMQWNHKAAHSWVQSHEDYALGVMSSQGHRPSKLAMGS